MYGMLPMENSTAGSINKAYDLLNDYDLRVHGETNLRVRHTLMTLPGQVDKIQTGEISSLSSCPV